MDIHERCHPGISKPSDRASGSAPDVATVAQPIGRVIGHPTDYPDRLRPIFEDRRPWIANRRRAEQRLAELEELSMQAAAVAPPRRRYAPAAGTGVTLQRARLGETTSGGK